MLEQILKELKTKYKNLGLSDTILKVVAEKLAITVKEENEIETAVAGVESELKNYQSFADQNRTLQKEIADLKKGNENPPKKEDEPENPPAPPKESGDVPEWAKSFTESIKAISESVETLKSEKTNQSNAEKLVSKFKELGVNENFYNLQIQGKTFTNDEEIEAFANTVKEAEDAYLQATNNKRLADTTNPPFGKQPVEGEVSADVQDYIKTKFNKNEEH